MSEIDDLASTIGFDNSHDIYGRPDKRRKTAFRTPSERAAGAYRRAYSRELRATGDPELARRAGRKAYALAMAPP